MKKALIAIAVLTVTVSATVLAVAHRNQRRLIPDLAVMFESAKIAESLPMLEKPFILVKKSERRLYLYDGQRLVKTYRVGLGFAPTGDKEREGDGKTPEGDFYIFTKNPKSNYYLSLGVSYPGIDDAERGLKQKLINQSEYEAITKAINSRGTPPQKTKLGGEIYIHGHGSKIDWTWGCIALENSDMKELFDAIPAGTNLRIEH